MPRTLYRFALYRRLPIAVGAALLWTALSLSLGIAESVSPSEEDFFGADWPPGPGREETGYLCNSCHSLAIVKQQGLSREDWDELLDWMAEEQGMPELEGEERALILDYLAAGFSIDRRLKTRQ